MLFSPLRTNEPTNDTHTEQDAGKLAPSSSSSKEVTEAREKKEDEVVKAKEDPVVDGMEGLKIGAAADQENSKPDEKEDAESVLREQQFIMAKSQMSPIAKNKTAAAGAAASHVVDQQDTSLISNDTSNLSPKNNTNSAASFSLNQSAISSSTTNRTTSTTNPGATTSSMIMRNVNSSLLIGGDSFNASTSCVGVVNSGVDLSLDSVVPYGDNE